MDRFIYQLCPEVDVRSVVSAPGVLGPTNPGNPALESFSWAGPTKPNPSAKWKLPSARALGRRTPYNALEVFGPRPKRTKSGRDLGPEYVGPLEIP
jgi:hypothetical protein